jgi:hypothetical protein
VSVDELQSGAHIGPVESIERDFRAFDDRNPQVYAELCRLARLWVERRSLRHLGVATLYEVTRWNLALRTEGDSFKLNNNHRALYARKIMAHEPDLDGLFHTRKLIDTCRCSRCVPAEPEPLPGVWA